ncbi:hypothetical protein PaG_03216 [Moesziomyces aphidis]|uniref:Uncharacterized protein n=1 Tax=Moesziomyces aphidis TaxID=84754 RepID=W3VLY5_MOEAP|nr:hypothetical protein PaG_03216 [Moesziomyces aphidis]
MATTSRRRSSHGLTSSGSSTQLARKGSSSRLGGPRGRFDPSLMMSSNAVGGDASRDKSPHADPDGPHDAEHHDKASRRNKSTDRLQRSRDSSTHLSGKRSKSFTHLAMTADESNRRRKSTKGKGKSQRPEATEDGWTSASADNTSSDHSAPLSPSSSPADEGLVLGIKKRIPPPLKPAASTTTLPEPKKEAFLQAPDTPRASAKTLEPEAESSVDVIDRRRLESPNGGNAPAPASSSEHISSPATLNREDTSKTLVHHASRDDTARMSPASALERDQFAIASDTSSASVRAPSRTDSALTIDTASHARHHRVSSSVSSRTLRTSLPAPASPSSVRSRSSVLSSRFLVFPREAQAAAPPMLDTHNALAGRLGARHEDRGDLLSPMAGPSRSGRSASAMTSSTSAPVALDKQQHAATDTRKVSLGHSPLSARSPGVVGPQAGSSTLGYSAQQRSARDDVAERRRTASTQSLTAADAAKLAAKLRLARDSMDDHALGAAGSSQRGVQAYNPRLEKHKKPVVSTFVKGSADETPQAIEVQANSVYSKLFAQAHDSQDGEEAGRRVIRYVMGYGISGPPIEQSRLSDALLGPSLDMAEFESSWAPALAHAAGLGGAMPGSMQTEYGLVAAEAPAATGGPNATPLHLIHGLTTTSPDPFPLDPTDVPALQEEGDVFEGHAMSQLAQNAIQLVDPGLIRAIAITTHAIGTHRSHVVTRRYADPMRESLERVVRSSGRYVPTAKSAGVGGNGAPDSPQISSRWGRKTAPNSPMSSRVEARDSAYRPGFQRRNTSDSQHGHAHSSASTNLAGQLYNLVDAAEHPVRSLKRVWSGGVARGGLAALTRTEEES